MSILRRKLNKQRIVRSSRRDATNAGINSTRAVSFFSIEQRCKALLRHTKRTPTPRLTTAPEVQRNSTRASPRSPVRPLGTNNTKTTPARGAKTPSRSTPRSQDGNNKKRKRFKLPVSSRRSEAAGKPCMLDIWGVMCVRHNTGSFQANAYN